MIDIKNLRIDYEDTTAVDDLNLEIGPGEIYGLVGPNGAGKTSTIKALAGTLEPTYGTILIQGIDLDIHPQKAFALIGYMPDFSPVYENLKAWEYLDVFAAAYHLPYPGRLKSVDHWLDRVNLQSKRNTLVRELSRGMRQRLVLAKTLLPDPKLLLLDEPASGLDPVARKDLHDILKNISSPETTILISSHILTELSGLCTSVGILEKGRLVVSGTLENIRKRLGSAKRLTIHLSEQKSDAAMKLLNFCRNCKWIMDLEEKQPTEFACSFTGSNEDASWVLSHIVKMDIPVCSFKLEEDNIEDIFFKVGAKAVS